MATNALGGVKTGTVKGRPVEDSTWHLDATTKAGLSALEGIVADSLTGPEPYHPPRWGRNDDRLATELFMRYGSVERGKFRSHGDWVDDANAVRAVLAKEWDARIEHYVAERPPTVGPMGLLLAAVTGLLIGLAVASPGLR